MKKKDIITVIIVAVVLAAVLASCLYLANRHRFLNNDNSAVIRSDYQIDGNFLYFNKNGTLMRYNSLTDEVSRLCGHEERNSECLLEEATKNIYLFNNRIYFRYCDVVLERYPIAYYDLSTGEIHKLNIVLDLNHSFFLSNGKIYYISNNAIFSASPDNGKSKKLTECSKTEDIIMVENDQIYTCLSDDSSGIKYSAIYSYNIKTLKKEEIYNFITSYYYPIAKIEYFEDRIYMIINISPINSSSAALENKTEKILFCYDTKTKKMNKLLDMQIDDFILTKNSIYYFPYEEREVHHIGTNLVGEHYTTSQVSCSENIYQCDHDGNNSKIIYANSAIGYEIRYIVNGKLFGRFVGDCPELGIDGKLFYASIDLITQKITKIEMPN